MQLYQRYGPAIRRKCERLLGSTEDAEDVMHALFLDIIESQRTVIDLAYLYRAATNRCLNLLRDRRRRTRLLARTDRAETGLPEATEILERLIDQQLLQRLFTGFDATCAEIFVYHYLDGMSQEEIAALLQLSRKTVGKKLKTIRLCARRLASEEKP